MTTDADRTDPPLAAGEMETLRGFLDYQRDTLRWKCSGLTSDQLGVPMPHSVSEVPLTLGGLVKHMVLVESWWFNQTFAGGFAKPSWLDEADLDDPNWEFTTASSDSPERLFSWLEEAQRVTDQILDDADLAAPAAASTWDRAPSLRWILVHMIEEYARHNGHADLIRESIDGATGE